MKILEFFNTQKEKILTILAVVVFFVLIAALLTLIQPFKYETKSRLLIIENLTTTDPYAISKANENLGNVLVNASVSDSFFNQVINSGFNIDSTYFGNNLASQMDIWKKTIVVKSINDTGIIEVSIFHSNRKQADQISQAVNYVLKTKHNLYQNDNNSTSIRILDNPVTSDWPVKPNIALNFSLAFIVGLVLGLVYIYLVSDWKIEQSEIKKTDNNESSDKSIQDLENVEMVSGQRKPLIQSDGFILGRSRWFKATDKQHLSEETTLAGSNLYNGLGQSKNLNNHFDFENNNVDKFKQEKLKEIKEIEEKLEVKETSNDDLDEIIKYGSMANIFGQSNLSK
jgi:capsular polysaccharide biosynthesis protein